MKLRRYLVTRTLHIIPVLFGILTLCFFICYVIPADPTRAASGEYAKASEIEALRREFGLDLPVYQQFLIYMNNLVHGNLGKSIRTWRPVLEDVTRKFPATFEICNLSLILSLLIGIPLGIISAIRRDTIADHISRTLSMMGLCTPAFWAALMFQLVFYYSLGILPVGGRIQAMASPETITGLYVLDSLLAWNWPALVSSLKSLVGPVLVLSLRSVGLISRWTRATLLEVLGQNYIKTAKSKGLSERVVVYKHALRNALIPIITVIGVSYGYSLGGSFAIETIFMWDGMGRYDVQSMLAMDYPAILGVTLVVGVIFLVINLVTDVLYAFIDPRIRYG